MNPAHKVLRERTRDAHDRVDAAFARFDLTNRADYQAMLEAHLIALTGYEARLDRCAGQADLLFDWPDRRRVPDLLEDLEQLAPNKKHMIGAINTAEPLSDPVIAGWLYVLEGSRLGGKFLARRLPADFPHKYLDPDQPIEKWREILDRIENYLYRPEHVESAIGAALDVFGAFERAGHEKREKVRRFGATG